MKQDQAKLCLADSSNCLPQWRMYESWIVAFDSDMNICDKKFYLLGNPMKTTDPHYNHTVSTVNLWEWCASRRCHSARLRCCCSCAPALSGPLFNWSPSPHPAVPVSVTEARLQKWSAKNPMGSSDLASTIFRMAPRSSSPTPACDRKSLSLSDFVALPSGIPVRVTPDRRFSLSAIAVDVPCRSNGSGSDWRSVGKQEMKQFVL